MLQRIAADKLAETFAVQSPRLNPHPIGFASRAITALVMAAFGALVAQAFLRQGLLVWSVGIAYILYDTALLVFTAREIWPLRHGSAHPHPSAAAPLPPSPAGRGKGPATAGGGKGEGDALSGLLPPTLAILVAARNEAAVLDVTIARLAAQDGAPDLILIADDGSDDATPATLAKFGLAQPAVGAISPPATALPSLRWLRLPHGGKARALNAAILHAREDIVVTVDADTLLEAGAIRAMRDAFAAEPELVAATGVIRPMCGPGPIARLFEWFQSYEYVRNFLSRHAWEQLGSLLLISGAFAAFRRDAVVAVGGFDPDCMVEDYELIHRLHRHAVDTGQDWRVRVVGRALAHTDAPATLPAFLRQRRRWFGGFLQVQHWNRYMVGDRRFGRLGTAMLPVKAADTMQPLFGLAAFGILGFVLATGRFRLVWPILAIMLIKIAIDLTFHLASLQLYKRWTGQREGLRWAPALAAAVLEPFTFQLFRHWGAVLGWWAFLTGRETWARQSRTGIAAVKRDEAGNTPIPVCLE